MTTTRRPRITSLACLIAALALLALPAAALAGDPSLDASDSVAIEDTSDDSVSSDSSVTPIVEDADATGAGSGETLEETLDSPTVDQYSADGGGGPDEPAPTPLPFEAGPPVAYGGGEGLPVTGLTLGSVFLLGLALSGFGLVLHLRGRGKNA